MRVPYPGIRGTAFEFLLMGPWIDGFATYGLRDWYLSVGLALMYAASRTGGTRRQPENVLGWSPGEMAPGARPMMWRSVHSPR